VVEPVAVASAAGLPHPISGIGAVRRQRQEEPPILTEPLTPNLNAGTAWARRRMMSSPPRSMPFRRPPLGVELPHPFSQASCVDPAAVSAAFTTGTVACFAYGRTGLRRTSRTRIASGGQGREGGGGALASSRDRLGCWGRVPAQVHGHYTDTGGGIHEPPRTPRTLSRKLLLSRHTPPPPVSRTPAVDGLLAAVVDDQ